MTGTAHLAPNPFSDFTRHVSRFDPDCSDAMVNETLQLRVAITMLSESLAWALENLSDAAKRDYEARHAARVLALVMEAEERARA